MENLFQHITAQALAANDRGRPIEAAMLGKDTDMARYILMNTESINPYLRVMPASKLDTGHRGYDKKKYTAMVRRAAWNLLRPFVPSEQCIDTQLYEKTSMRMLSILYGGGLLLRHAR